MVVGGKYVKTEYNGKVVSVDGTTTIDKLLNYLEYHNRWCNDDTGMDLSYLDIIELLDSEECRELFSK